MPKRRRSGSRRNLKLVLIVLVVLFFLGGVAYVVWLSDVFKTQSIEVHGATLVDENVVAGALGGNILFWKLPIDIKNYPQIESVSTKKDFIDRSVRIEVIERGKMIIWCEASGENCFWTDENGFIFTMAPIPEGSLVVSVVRDYNERELNVGQNVLPEDLFINLKYALELLDSVDVSVEEIRIDDLKFKEATAVISGGPEVYFSLNIDPRFGKGVLEALLNSPDWGAIRYVDLRVENRAYYSL